MNKCAIVFTPLWLCVLASAAHASALAIRQVAQSAPAPATPQATVLADATLRAQACWAQTMPEGGYNPNADLPNDFTSNLARKNAPAVGINIVEDEHGTIRSIEPGKIQHPRLPSVHLVVDVSLAGAITAIRLHPADQPYLQSPAYNQQAQAAAANLKICNPFIGLPAQHYAAWKRLYLTYDTGRGTIN